MYRTTVQVPYLGQDTINELAKRHPGIEEFLPLIETAEQAGALAQKQYDEGLDSDFSWDYVEDTRSFRDGNVWNVELKVHSH